MKCLKRTKRTFFNLLEIFSCDNCMEFINYSYTYIGNNTINIYEVEKDCFNLKKGEEYLKLFIKDSIINDKDSYLILKKQEYLYIFDYLPLLIDNNNLFIFII